MADQPGRSLDRKQVLRIALVIVVLLAIIGVILIVRGTQQGTAVPIPVATGIAAPIEGPTPTGQQTPVGGMSIRLSEGRAAPQTTEQNPVAAGQPLSSGEISQLLGRLPALTAEPSDQTEFNLPAQPLPPPLPGQTIEQTFPIPEASPPPEVGEAGPRDCSTLGDLGADFPPGGGRVVAA